MCARGILPPGQPCAMRAKPAMAGTSTKPGGTIHLMTFGHSMLEHWRLDPACLYLNHGTVGVTPRRVLLKQQALRDEMERQPSRFMLRELNAAQPMPWRAVSRLREASDQVAAFVGARPDDLVFVPNVTTGLNAVMGSTPLGPDDELVHHRSGVRGRRVRGRRGLRAHRRDPPDRSPRVPHPDQCRCR